MDFDFKHIVKRICTMICSKDGMMVNGRLLNKQLFSLWLEKLTQYDWSETSIYALLNPADPQDVPRAIALLSRIAELRSIDTTNLAAADKDIHDTWSLLGEDCYSLLRPYNERTLTLSEQTIKAVTCAHLTLALYKENTTHFISNQLYNELQCMFKTIIMTVTETQVQDPNAEVHISLNGTDGPETLFGRRHPEWERRSNRLKSMRDRDYDHLRPRDWVGDLVAGHCGIAACWRASVAKATEILKCHGLTIDFDALFSQPGVDLMRPRGGDISRDVDISMTDVYTSEDGSSGLSQEHGATQSPVAGPSGDSAGGATTLDEECAVAALEEMHTSEASSDQDVPPKPHSRKMDIGYGEERDKAAVLRILFQLGDLSQSHDRLLRVRGYRIGGDHWDRTVGIIDGKELDEDERFRIGNLFATLWVWTTDFAAFEPARGRQNSSAVSTGATNSPKRRGELVITVPSQLTILLSDEPRDVDIYDLPDDLVAKIQRPVSSTTIIDEVQIKRLRSELWDSRFSCRQQELNALIPTYGEVTVGTFPYGATRAEIPRSHGFEQMGGTQGDGER
ncbi:hypothetical protein GGF50DRAFT_121126 [Schizophyllum commune]